MAGHSHWAGIKHKKGRHDKERSKIFAKLSREITVAAKLGAKDPESNPRLRTAIQSAKQSNMPKDNIARAINKSETDKSQNYENLRYEGFGPHNVALIIETLSDNKNRTASNIRTILQKNGGNLGTQGSASHYFDQIGVIKIDNTEISFENIFEISIECEATDCIQKKNYHEIHCNKNEIYNVKKRLEHKIENFISTEIEWIPINYVEVSSDRAEETKNFLETLEEDEDVQKVYSNISFGAK